MRQIEIPGYSWGLVFIVKWKLEFKRSIIPGEISPGRSQKDSSRRIANGGKKDKLDDLFFWHSFSIHFLSFAILISSNLCDLYVVNND